MRDALLLVRPGVEDSGRLERFERIAIDQLGSAQARAASAFLLDEEASGDPAVALRVVRGHPWPSVYLKPVILLADESLVAPALSRSVDGVWDATLRDEVPPGLAAKVERLRQRANSHEATGPEGDSQLSFRILRFMASRGGSFEPAPTISAASGFRYPPLYPFLGSDDASAGAGEILSALESQRVLEGVFCTKAYACAHCGCGFLSFLEVCPDCGSADLRVDDMVHHFRCGYVAPLADFMRGEAMLCPKCDRPLHQVGVDYDKPSLVYDCNECQHRSSEPVITTSCYQCRRVTPPEMQVHRDIKTYTVTPFGENAAAHGLDSMFVSVLQQRVTLFDHAVFKQLLAAEIHRIDRYERSESTLVVLSFRGIEQIYVELGSRARELFEGVTVAFKSVLRESDLLSARNESLFLALLAETSVENAQRAVERLKEAIDQLMSVGLKSPPTLAVAIHPLSAGLDADAVVGEVLAQQGAGARIGGVATDVS